MTHRYHKVTKV